MNHLKISTAELAKICGVSQGTVDRALNNRHDIKAETKQKIIRTARQYGYRKHIDAQADDKILGLIGIIVFNLNNEYFSKLITETEYVLKKHGFGAVVMMTHYDKECEIECIRKMYNMGVTGIMLCSVNNGVEFDNYLKLFNIPIVAVGNRINSIPYVGTDDFAAMREMTEKLINDGYEKFVYFSPALKYDDAYAQRVRYEGFLNAASNKEFTVVKNIDEIKDTYDDKTAVICSTDYYALQVYFRAQNVKIVGFDNIDAIEKYKLKIDSVGCSVAETAMGAVKTILENTKEDIIVKHKIVEH